MAISVGTTYYSSKGKVYNYGGNVTSGYEVRLKYVLNSYDIKTNKHNVTSTLQMRTTSTSYNTYGNVDATRTIQGVSSSLSWIDSWTNTNWRDIYSRTFELEANSNGKLTTDLTGSFKINDYAWSPSSGALKSASVSESVEFPTIPRKSDVSCSSFNCGDSTSIIVSKKSDSFTSTIRYKFGSLSGTIVSKIKDKVIPWTPDADDFYEQFPNAKSLKGTVYCDTYNGNTLIGTTEATFTCNAKEDECKPIITLNVIDVNENTKRLTGNENVIVKGMSNAKLTSTITYRKSATASSYGVSSGDGKKSNSNPAILESVNSGLFTATATDSRKYSGSDTVEKTVENGLLVDYVKLAFATVNIGRPETTSNIINVELKGNYYNGNFANAGKRNIKVGDDLSGKTLYFDFPQGLYESIHSNDGLPVRVIQTNNKRITENSDTAIYTEWAVGIHNGDEFYHCTNETGQPVETTLENYTLSNDFGIVAEINTDSASYKYIKIDADEPVPNTIELKFRHRENGGEWSDYVELTPTITENSFYFDGSLGENFDYQKQYEFEFYAEDELMYVSASDKPIIVTKGISIIRVGDGYVDIRGDIKQHGRLLNSYPEGSIYISSTNSNPSSLFGGTWELIDKDFKSLHSNSTSYFTPTSNVASYGIMVVRTPKFITIRLNIKNAVPLADNEVNFGTLNFEKLGITELYYSLLSQVGATDGGGCAILFDVQWETGQVSSVDIIQKDGVVYVAENSSCYFQINLPAYKEIMLDSACDKFYWKRTA